MHLSFCAPLRTMHIVARCTTLRVWTISTPHRLMTISTLTVPAPPRTSRGADEMKASIERQLVFSAVPTALIGSCCIGGLVGGQLFAAAQHPLAAQAVVALFGASALSALFNLAHSNSVYAGLQYCGRGLSQGQRRGTRGRPQTCLLLHET